MATKTTSSSTSKQASGGSSRSRGGSGRQSSRAISEEDLPSLCREAIERLVDLKINFLAIDFDQTILSIHTGGKWTGTSTELATHVRPLFKHFINAANDGRMELAVVTFSPQVNIISEVLQAHFPTFASSIVIRGRDGSWSYDGSGSRSGKQGHMASAVEELEARRQRRRRGGGGGGGGGGRTTATGGSSVQQQQRQQQRQRSKQTSSQNDLSSSSGGGGSNSDNNNAKTGEGNDHDNVNADDNFDDITKRSTLLIDDDANNCRVALLDGVRAVWLNPSRPERLLGDLMRLS